MPVNARALLTHGWIVAGIAGSITTVTLLTGEEIVEPLEGEIQQTQLEGELAPQLEGELQVPLEAEVE